MPYFVHFENVFLLWTYIFYQRTLCIVYMAISERTVLIYVNQYTKYIQLLIYKLYRLMMYFLRSFQYYSYIQIKNHSSTFVIGPILMNANIMKKQYETWNVTFFLLWWSFVIFFFKTFWPNYNLDLHSYGQLLSLFY